MCGYAIEHSGEDILSMVLFTGVYFCSLHFILVCEKGTSHLKPHNQSMASRCPFMGFHLSHTQALFNLIKIEKGHVEMCERTESKKNKSEMMDASFWPICAVKGAEVTPRGGGGGRDGLPYTLYAHH